MNEGWYHQFVWWVIGTLFLLSLDACHRKEKGPVNSQEKPVAAIAVEVEPARIQRVQRKVDFVGSFVAENTLTVSSEVDGRVMKIFADVGDHVNRGQVLVSLDDTDYRLAVEQAEGQWKSTLSRLGFQNLPATPILPEETANAKRAKAQLDMAKADYERITALFEEGAVSRADLDRAKTALQVASETYQAVLDETRSLLALLQAQEAQLALARKKLDSTTIVSPIRGVVTKRRVEVGEYVSARMGGAPVMEVVNLSPVKLVSIIPERYLPDLRTGQRVEVRVASVPGRVFAGTVHRISPDVNPNNRTLRIEALFPNEDEAIKPGSFAEGEVITSTDDRAVVVPKKAVVSYAGIHRVFVIKEGKASARQIVVGRSLADDIEVVSGVEEGEVVAVSGVNTLYDGAPVSIRQRDGGHP